MPMTKPKSIASTVAITMITQKFQWMPSRGEERMAVEYAPTAKNAT